MKPLFSLESLAQLLTNTSFDSPWYWIFFATSWSLATYWTLGVGHHDSHNVLEDAGIRADFETSIGIYVRRNTIGFDKYGPVFIAIMFFLIASAAIVGFGRNAPLLQAFFWLLFPLMLAFFATLRVCYRLAKEPEEGEQLLKTYYWLRRTKQVIGMLAIMCTSFWGALVLYSKWLVIGG